jgi:hypothetical protein
MTIGTFAVPLLTGCAIFLLKTKVSRIITLRHSRFPHRFLLVVMSMAHRLIRLTHLIIKAARCSARPALSQRFNQLNSISIILLCR